MQSWRNSCKIVQKCNFLDFLVIPEGKGRSYILVGGPLEVQVRY